VDQAVIISARFGKARQGEINLKDAQVVLKEGLLQLGPRSSSKNTQPVIRKFQELKVSAEDVNIDAECVILRARQANIVTERGDKKVTKVKINAKSVVIKHF